MKKKVMMMGAGLTLGSALLVSSAFAGIGGARAEPRGSAFCLGG